LFKSTSKASLLHHSETLLSDLATLRRKDEDKANPIFFIAHSLGGIVVKDALNISAVAKSFDGEILPATNEVMFLRTPHQGSRTASLGKIAFELSRVLLQRPNIQVLRGLEVNSEALERVASTFASTLSNADIKVPSFREELAVKGVMIVEPVSATIGHPLETRGSLHANHREMAKFSSLSDTKFKRIVQVLEKWSLDTQVNSQPPIAFNKDLEDEYKMVLKALGFLESKQRMNDIESRFGTTYGWLLNDGGYLVNGLLDVTTIRFSGFKENRAPESP
jgi:hypothetical protein